MMNRNGKFDDIVVHNDGCLPCWAPSAAGRHAHAHSSAPWSFQDTAAENHDEENQINASLQQKHSYTPNMKGDGQFDDVVMGCHSVSSIGSHIDTSGKKDGKFRIPSFDQQDEKKRPFAGRKVSCLLIGVLLVAFFASLVNIGLGAAETAESKTAMAYENRDLHEAQPPPTPQPPAWQTHKPKMSSAVATTNELKNSFESIVSLAVTVTDDKVAPAVSGTGAPFAPSPDTPGAPSPAPSPSPSSAPFHDSDGTPPHGNGTNPEGNGTNPPESVLSLDLGTVTLSDETSKEELILLSQRFSETVNQGKLDDNGDALLLFQVLILYVRITNDPMDMLESFWKLLLDRFVWLGYGVGYFGSPGPWAFLSVILTLFLVCIRVKVGWNFWRTLFLTESQARETGGELWPQTMTKGWWRYRIYVWLGRCNLFSCTYASKEEEVLHHLNQLRSLVETHGPHILYGYYDMIFVLFIHESKGAAGSSLSKRMSLITFLLLAGTVQNDYEGQGFAVECTDATNWLSSFLALAHAADGMRNHDEDKKNLRADMNWAVMARVALTGRTLDTDREILEYTLFEACEKKSKSTISDGLWFAFLRKVVDLALIKKTPGGELAIVQLKAYGAGKIVAEMKQSKWGITFHYYMRGTKVLDALRQ